MTRHLLLILAFAFLFLTGCVPSREITYSLDDIQPAAPNDSISSITRGFTLCINPFADVRETIPENGVLFVRERETKLHDADYCINAETHYKPNSIPTQLSALVAAHLGQRRTFKMTSINPGEQSDYSLFGDIRRLYGEQEFSDAARAGSYFGLIGAIATAGAKTKGLILIEFGNLRIRRNRDGAELKIPDIETKFSGELHADAYCWCIYDNVNAQVKTTVEKLALAVERAVAALESSQSTTPNTPSGAQR